MKKLLTYLKKHFLSIITLIAGIVASVVVNCLENISIFENIILWLVVLLITTFIFDFNIMLDSIKAKQDEYEKHLYPSTIQDFKSVDECADIVKSLVKDGQHNIDFVSLDTCIRTTEEENRHIMVQLLDNFISNPKIKLRYLSSINKKNFRNTLQYIIKNKDAQKESYYALCESKIPFASYYLIDENM